MERGEALTVAQAAREAGVANETIRRAAREGRLRARKFGRDWVIIRADLEYWQQYGQHTPGRPRSVQREVRPRREGGER